MTIDAAGIALPRPRRRTRVLPKGWDTATGHALMILVSIICVFPIYWMIVTSLRPANAIFSTRIWPDAASLDNYAYALQAVPMYRMLMNTFVVSTAVTLVQLLTGILAGYAFARWRFHGAAILFGAIALTWLVPLQVVMIPNYLLVARMGMIDTLGALILPHFASAFAIMLLAQSMRSFPSEVNEAARMDGATMRSEILHVLVPMAVPGIASGEPGELVMLSMILPSLDTWTAVSSSVAALSDGSPPSATGWI